MTTDKLTIDATKIESAYDILNAFAADVARRKTAACGRLVAFHSTTTEIDHAIDEITTMVHLHTTMHHALTALDDMLNAVQSAHEADLINAFPEQCDVGGIRDATELDT